MLEVAIMFFGVALGGTAIVAVYDWVEGMVTRDA